MSTALSAAIVAIADWKAEGNPNAVLRITGADIYHLPHVPDSARHVYISCEHLFHTGDLSSLTALVTLEFEYCPLLYLVGELPSGLQTLRLTLCGMRCDGSSCPKLAPLPSGLQTLRVEECPLFRCVGELPSGLQTLCVRNCRDVQFDSACALLPAGLEELRFENCRRLARLPPLPVGLDWLACWNCPLLTRLPRLPATLQILSVQDCVALAYLPPLPTGLLRLLCSGCALLRYLPPLPATLYYLHCVDSGFTSLPPLPADLEYFGPHTTPVVVDARLPDVRPRKLRSVTAAVWKRSVRAQHAVDRAAAAPHLPSAALLFL
jgi:hypothetical protein